MLHTADGNLQAAALQKVAVACGGAEQHQILLVWEFRETLGRCVVETGDEFVMQYRTFRLKEPHQFGT